jgi:hypothetical protein
MSFYIYLMLFSNLSWLPSLLYDFGVVHQPPKVTNLKLLLEESDSVAELANASILEIQVQIPAWT